MQLLADVGLEDGEWTGLGLVPGTCERLPGGVKIPHIGWNTVEYPRDSPLFDGHRRVDGVLLRAQYRLVPRDDSVAIGSTEYGVRFASAVQTRQRLRRAVPSREVLDRGLKLLANFGRIAEEGTRMIVFPAIDILGGRAVRLAQGDYERVTVYNEDPSAQARAVRRARAPSGSTSWTSTARATACRGNIEVVERIVREAGVPARGRRRHPYARDDRPARRCGRGAHRARHQARRPTRSSSRAAVAAVGDGVVAGVDARDGMVAVEGWREGPRRAQELVGELRDLGVRHLVYTDISGRDADRHQRAAYGASPQRRLPGRRERWRLDARRHPRVASTRLRRHRGRDRGPRALRGRVHARARRCAARDGAESRPC